MSAAPPVSRSRRMLEFIARNAGTSLGPLIAHLCAHERATPRPVVAQAVYAATSQFIAAGKITRSGKPMAYRYWPTELTLQDLRRVDRAGNPRDKKARARASAKPKAARKTTTKAPTTPKAPRTTPLPTVLPKAAPTGAPHGVRDVSADVAAFLAAGGKVVRLQPHEASRSLRFDHSQTHVPACRRPAVRRRHAHAR